MTAGVTAQNSPLTSSKAKKAVKKNSQPPCYPLFSEVIQIFKDVSTDSHGMAANSCLVQVEKWLEKEWMGAIHVCPHLCFWAEAHPISAYRYSPWSQKNGAPVSISQPDGPLWAPAASYVFLHTMQTGDFRRIAWAWLKNTFILARDQSKKVVIVL